MSKRINCLQCRHYFSTYQPDLPRGCKVFNFKSMQFPSVLVKQETGKECQAFELTRALKEKHNKKAKEIDLNDDDLW